MKREPESDWLKAVIAKIESGYIPAEQELYKRKKSFSPSTLVWGNGKCPRYWYLAFEGGQFIESRSATEYANMLNGTAAHERLQQAMEAAGMLVAKEIEVVYNNPPVFGFCDADIKIDDEPVLVEIKTTKQESFSYRKTANNAAKYHLEQLLMYMYMLNRPKGILLYESKDNHELFAVLVEWTEERKQWILYLFSWLKETHMAWRNKQIPKKTYRANSKVCKNCPLKAECDAAETGSLIIKPLQGLE